jgi:hypothetical protein
VVDACLEQFVSYNRFDFDTRWINLELPRSKYNKAGKKGQDFDDNGKLKPEIAHLILTNLMASRPDFAVEKSYLEHLADELGCIVRFTAKYHCKIAGEGAENGCWGFSKKIYHCLPIAKKRYVDVLTKSVKNCLIQVTPERARRFSRRKYMLAYQLLTRLMTKALPLPHLNGSKCSMIPASP